MRLTKEIRENIIDKLLSKAVEEKNGEMKARYAALCARITKDVFERFCAETGANRKIYESLVQAGSIRTSSSFRAKRKDKESSQFREAYLPPFKDDFGFLPNSIQSWLGRSTVRYANCTYVRFLYDRTMPEFDSEENGAPAELIDAAEAFLDELWSFLTMVVAFHHELAMAVGACNTLKQLEEHFPEAAALVPKQQSVGKALIPTGKINSVREKIKAGIPPKKS